MSVEVQEFEKARDEEDVYAIDFSEDLADDEDIEEVLTFEVLDAIGSDCSEQFHVNDSPAPAVSGQTVVFWLRNAEAITEQIKREYRINCLIRTSLDREIEARRDGVRPVIRMLAA